MSLGQARITAIIPTRNRPQSLADCLAALALQHVDEDFRILVIDDGSEEAEVQSYREVIANSKLSDLHLVHIPHRGPGLARNAGVELAQTPLICFLDDDCLPPPRWISSILQTFDEDPQLAMAGGPLLLAFCQGPGAAALNAHYLDLVAAAEHRCLLWSDGFTPFRTPVTANLAVRKADWLELGGCPQSCAFLADDVSVLYAFLAAGKKVANIPALAIQHRFEQSLWKILHSKFYRYGRADALAMATCFPHSFILDITLEPFCQRSFQVHIPASAHSVYLGLDRFKIFMLAMLLCAGAKIPMLSILAFCCLLGFILKERLRTSSWTRAGAVPFWLFLFSLALLLGRIKGSLERRTLCL